MDSFRVGVKGFIVDEQNSLLVIKRRDDDVHMAGFWEIPGGRLEIGEDPFEGLKREIREEIGIGVEVKEPLTVRHFTRQDGQKVTMLVFRCSPLDDKGSIRLSEEHTECKWINLDDEDENIMEYLGNDAFFMKEVEAYRKNIGKITE